MKSDEAASVTSTAGVPEAWFDSRERHTFMKRLEAAPGSVLLLDYDGTLAPFHADRMSAFPYPGVAEALEKLRAISRVRLVLVTGRKAEDLEHLVHVAKYVEVWGSHGREHITADRQYTLFPPSAAQTSALDAMKAEIESALRGVRLHPQSQGRDLFVTSQGSQALVETPEPLERKPASLAVHWRGLSIESQRILQQTAEAAYGRHGSSVLERLLFESGVEFRAVGRTKAFAVNQVIQETAPSDVIAYLGDDITDEDAFAKLGDRGLSLLVRAQPRASRASHWLCPPEELRRFLDDWIAASLSQGT